MNNIFKRASVRTYLEKPIEEEKIELLLKAAMAAPSAKNSQPWEFVVVDDKSIMLKITEFHPYSSMLKHAPLAIVVCADKNKEFPDLKGYDYWVQDCSAATQNIMLQATDLGLGSVWLGVYPREQIYQPLAKLLDLPSNIIPVSVVSIGYPASDIMPKDKFNLEKIHRNKWVEY